MTRYIVESGICKKEEKKKIDEQLSRRSGPIVFRNKTLAHNEKSLTINWSEIDEDIALLSRIWSLSVIWNSTPIVKAALEHKNSLAFISLENVFSDLELKQLADKRAEYIDEFYSWCVTNCVSGKKEKNNPFISFNIQIDFK